MLQALHGGAAARHEVGCVLEEMLLDLEVWDAENRRRHHQGALARRDAAIALLEAEVASLEALRLEGEERSKARAGEAMALRETLVAELWTLSKAAKSSSALEKKVARAEEQLAKVRSKVTEEEGKVPPSRPLAHPVRFVWR